MQTFTELSLHFSMYTKYNTYVVYTEVDSTVEVVPGVGLEPTSPCEHDILSVARIPIPPPGQKN